MLDVAMVEISLTSVRFPLLLSVCVRFSPTSRAVNNPGQRLRVGFHHVGYNAAVDKQSMLARFDETSILKYLEMMRHSSRRHPPQGDDFAAIHLFPGGDGLKNSEPGFIRQRLGDLLNLRAVHSLAGAAYQRFVPLFAKFRIMKLYI